MIQARDKHYAFGDLRVAVQDAMGRLDRHQRAAPYGEPLVMRYDGTVRQLTDNQGEYESYRW